VPLSGFVWATSHMANLDFDEFIFESQASSVATVDRDVGDDEAHSSQASTLAAPEPAAPEEPKCEHGAYAGAVVVVDGKRLAPGDVCIVMAQDAVDFNYDKKINRDRAPSQAAFRRLLIEFHAKDMDAKIRIILNAFFHDAPMLRALQAELFRMEVQRRSYWKARLTQISRAMRPFRRPAHRERQNRSSRASTGTSTSSASVAALPPGPPALPPATVVDEDDDASSSSSD